MDEFKEKKAKNLMGMRVLGNKKGFDNLRKGLADTFQTKDYMEIMMRADVLFERYLEVGGK